MAYKVLVVDDQKDICALLSDVLKDDGYATLMAYDSQTALKMMQEHLPDVLVLDIWLNDSRFDGIEVLDIIKQNFPDVPVIMISGHATIETAVSALHKGAFDFIEKPFNSERLLSIVSKAIELTHLKRELAALKKKSAFVETLTGDSNAIKNLAKTILKIAPTNSRIMIEGGAGAGKEVVARMIHAHSLRSSGPFVTVNCANLDAKKLSEELFGFEKNVGRPDVEIHMGLLEQANGGTLFLDNIADMPLDTQARIMQLLQEQRFKRVGGNRDIEADVRIISAASIPLKPLIESGKLREDLYYRLCVVPVHVPSLTERREDIPVLVQHFFESMKEEGALAAKSLSKEAEIILQNYNWPGNVRQLKNVIEWLTIMTPKDKMVIGADLLPQELSGGHKAKAPTEGTASLLDLPLKEAREAFEREYIKNYIHRHNGNIARTAQEIGMERTALHRKIKSLNIEFKSREDE
jgi:two-component system nitrogen regulation response regulator NtrX